jgi:hypothetical protein
MHITITSNGWLAHVMPKFTRAQLVRNIYSLATQKGMEVRISGQHW